MTPEAGANAPSFSPLVVDVLRGVAASSVYFAHADLSNLVESAWITRHKEFLGAFGVDLFFFLSGFLIWVSARRTLGADRGHIAYFVHRITRIAPLYYVNLAFAALLLPQLASTFTPTLDESGLWRHLFFTQALDPPVSRQLNPVLWTLTHEALYYALVPALVLATRWIRLEWLLLAAIGTMLCASELAGPLVPFFRVFWLFLVGAVMAERGTRADTAVLIAVVALVPFAITRNVEPKMLATLSAFGCFLVLMSDSAARHLERWRPAAAPVAFVGLVSYSLYIWHYVLLNIIAGNSDVLGALLGGYWMHDTLRALLVTTAVLAASTLSYYAIEYPAMGPVRRRLLQWLSATRPSRPVALAD